MGRVQIKIDWDMNYGAAPVNENVACVVTGKTLDEVKANMAESLRLHLESMREDGDAIPGEFEGQLEFDYLLTARALLHYVENFVPRSALAEASGISTRQLGHYYTGEKHPRPQQIERIKNGIKAITAQLSALSL
ncbi:type II toxin-antitoxin system HicB family antitoxin [uncultured Alistipes sp.]|uniref:type II toxin-antitoxin system HicB family antitoxin n=1 Tax=uncultured Alistipes sp. TaxID=538949 RepID=UPI002619252B|nr:type II toxin-antitoxin system HicB family antitoxin [uncultured Alistipes sp.]